MGQTNYVQTGPLWASYPTDTVKCEEVIICFNKRIGKGVEGDPVRIVLQVFTKKGEIIAERDMGDEFGIITTATEP